MEYRKISVSCMKDSNGTDWVLKEDYEELLTMYVEKMEILEKVLCHIKNVENVDNAEHDGCTGCKYEYEPCDHPQCTGCKCNATDNYTPATNADRIHNMSDEELADQLTTLINCADVIFSGSVADGKANILEWLRRKA